MKHSSFIVLFHAVKFMFIAENILFYIIFFLGGQNLELVGALSKSIDLPA